MMRKLPIWIISGLFLLSACSEEFEAKPFTYTKLLTGEVKKSWRATALQVRAEGQPPQNFVLPDTDCLFDDLYIFYANAEKLFEVDDDLRKCSPEDPDIIVSDSWSFVNANATLEIVVPFLAPFRLPFVVKELDENEMTLEIWLDIDNTESYRIFFDAVNTF